MTDRPRDAFGAVAEEFAAWTESTGQAPGADPQEARLLLDLMRDHLGIEDPGDLGPGDLRELLLEVYPRKVTVLDRQDAADTVPTARALLGFLAETGRVDRPAPLREELDRLEPDFLDAVMDPARWGLARAFTQAMAADGVDFGDQAAVDAWIARHNERQRLGLVGDEDPFDDDVRFGGDPFGGDQVDLREAFGLPDQMPALRLPGRTELARAARCSTLLAQARELAVWAGDGGRALTDDGELVPADAGAAARVLGAGPPPGAAGGGGLPALRQAWHLARCLWFVEEEQGCAVTGEAAAGWPDGDDDEVLDVWSQALAHVAGHSLAVDDQDGSFPGLMLGGAAGGLLMALFLTREDGLARGECRELVRETATGELSPAAGRKIWTAWARAHGDMADVLLGRLAGHGAVQLDGDTARLTPLGLWRMREELSDEIDIPLLPEPEDMTAADLVAFCVHASESELDRERDAWLAARPAAQAARELLRVATDGGCAERMIGTSLATGIGAAAEPAWRDGLAHPSLRPYAKVALGQIAGRDPAADPLPGLEMGPDDAVALLGDVVAAMADELSGAELAATLRQAVPSGQEEQVIERMWRSDHPAAEQALAALGRHHPDKKLAKAARKAAFKARSRR
jgi:hypothetical protein